MTRPRIAFVVPYGYPALTGTGFDYVGGAEMQQARLARVLAGRGHDVWMLSADFGQLPRIKIDGITIERAYQPFAGLPGLRFFYPRWSGVVSALDRAQPDIVYQRTAGVLTGQCALWARGNGKRFVFACAHDFDTLPASPVLTDARARFFYRWGLHHADRVLAQSESQAEALVRNHGITAKVVRNVIPLPASARPSGAADSVVWLGTIKAEKRPTWVLEAARALPHVRFVLAGGPPPPPMPDTEARIMKEEALTLPNVELLGFVRPEAVPALLARALLFVHTSPAEGFPNTLLEAWAQGVPSVSVVDPDGAVSQGGAGVQVWDLAGFVEAVRDLTADAARREFLGANARAWVAARHAPEVVASVFEEAVGLGAATPEVR
jgi:glycosyltransferase involved in cell wall biosynthesis